MTRATPLSGKKLILYETFDVFAIQKKMVFGHLQKENVIQIVEVRDNQGSCSEVLFRSDSLK